jgi:UDP-glucose 4-epimerase
VRVAITGGAGFIGSNLADALSRAGHDVVVVDNFSTGTKRFLEDGEEPFPGEVFVCDLVEEPEKLVEAFRGADAVAHLAANADVRFGWDHPDRDLQQNIVGTHNVCEAMRNLGIPRLLFTSTGSVYGEAKVIPTPEDCPFPIQSSLYGASKLAAEGMVAAYAEAGLLHATVFRLVSIMGPRYTHGHVVDFMAKLQRDPTRLPILGDGTQRKSYLDVSDCVRAMEMRLPEAPGFEVLNLGVDGYCTVADSAGWILERMGGNARLEFSGGDRGWIGDNPFIWLDTQRIRSLGWEPRVTIRQAVERTVDYLLENPWVLERAVAE